MEISNLSTSLSAAGFVNPAQARIVTNMCTEKGITEVPELVYSILRGALVQGQYNQNLLHIINTITLHGKQ